MHPKTEEWWNLKKKKKEKKMFKYSRLAIEWRYLEDKRTARLQSVRDYGITYQGATLAQRSKPTVIPSLSTLRWQVYLL